MSDTERITAENSASGGMGVTLYSDTEEVLAQDSIAVPEQDSDGTEALTEESAEGEAQDAKDSAEKEDIPESEPTDYEALAAEDMRQLITLFPHLEGKRSVAELDNPLRYAALRDLGLTPAEAYLATNYRARSYDNRSHLQSAVPKPAAAQPNLLGSRELEAARELFADLSDREIQRLYKKVSK